MQMIDSIFNDPRFKRVGTNLPQGPDEPVRIPPARISYSFTGNTPEVILDKRSGTAFLFGRLLCENPYEFFQPLIEWAGSYVENPQPVTVVTINSDYINTGSSKALLEFLIILASVQFTGRKIIIKWYSDKGDDITLELIENMSDIIKVKIQIEQPQ